MKWIKNKPLIKMYTLMELCTGTGGFSLGFHTTNKVNTLYANDYVKSSQLIYTHNFPSVPFECKDLNTVELNQLPETDILTSGFSCQPFSISGLQHGFEDTRSFVFLKTIQVMKLKQPKIVILENVKNILTHDKTKTLTRILECIKDAGYQCSYSLLNTSNHTPIPQNRERVYFICVRNDLKQFRVYFPNTCPHSFNVSECISSNQQKKKYYYTNRFKIWPMIEEKVIEIISTNTIYQYRRTDVRENKTKRFPTITANAGSGGHNVLILKDKFGIRKMTPREYFLIQGFNDEYTFPPQCSDSALYKLAGNAISVPIIQSLASHIVHELDLNEQECTETNEDLTSHEILDLYIHFKTYYNLRKTIYATRKKKHRAPNFPEDVSENIVRFYIGSSCTWNTSTGDLLNTKENERVKIEVKCVNSHGPMSFGPKTIWDELYILEWINFDQDCFRIYKIPFPNSHHCIQSLKVSKHHTYEDQCKLERRPRLTLKSFKTQMNGYLEIVFNGSIYECLAFNKCMK